MTPEIPYLKTNIPPMRRVINEVAKAAKIKPAQIIGKDRTRLTSRARQVAMLICRDYCGASYPEIGRVFQRDHTTVIYNVEKASEACCDADWDDMEAIATRCGLVEDLHV